VVAERTAGLAWLRWFLHRILPFPTFLFDRTYLTVSLGIERLLRQRIYGLDLANYGPPLALDQDVDFLA
jgi:hypothetical protein